MSDREHVLPEETPVEGPESEVEAAAAAATTVDAELDEYEAWLERRRLERGR